MDVSGRWEVWAHPTAFSICDACALCSQALYWFNYELVKSWLSGLRPKDRPSVGISFVAGGVSGTVSGWRGSRRWCPWQGVLWGSPCMTVSQLPVEKQAHPPGEKAGRSWWNAKRTGVLGMETSPLPTPRPGGGHPDSPLRRGEDSTPGRAGCGGGCER